MLLVLLQHANVPGGGWILSFHMPLFFLLSGYLASFREQKATFWTYIKPKFFRLLLPYFLFEGVNLLLWIVYQAQFGIRQNVADSLLSIFLCTNRYYTGFYGRLWFWPCLFVCELYFYWIRKWTKENKGLLWVVAAVMLGLSWCTTRLEVRLPLATDAACMAEVFFIAGFAMKDGICWLIKQRKWLLDLLIGCVLLYLLRKSVLDGGGYYLMFENCYGPLLWSVLGAFSGSGIFLIIAKWLYHLLNRIRIGKQLILWYGTNSLAVFPVHLAIKTGIADILYYRVLASNIGILLQYSGHMTAWYVLFPAMLVGSVPIVNIITCYFPFLLGKMPGKVRLLTNRPE